MEHSNKPINAVTYSRVSTAAQLKKGDGLASQETRCREYARQRGYKVIQSFNDRGVSGGDIDRPGMQSMLAFLRTQEAGSCVCIIDDINRFSRDIMVHWQLRALLAEAGGKLESPSIEFGDDSDSILVENLLASVSQHQRQKNGEQTKNRMRARAMNGYYVFIPPVAYKYKKVAGHGNIMVRHEPIASILQEALEGFASGRFETQGEVKAFLESQPDYPKETPDGKLRWETLPCLMKKILYTGYFEIPRWDIPLRKGHHEPIISLETFDAVQRRLKEKAKAPARKDISADFPLRGFVLCDDCSKPFTACWSTSKTGKKHPYYLCHTKTCASYRKSIRRDDMEEQFAKIIETMQPTQTLFDMTKAMFKTAWSFRLQQSQDIQKAFDRELKEADSQIDKIVDRMVDTNNPRVITAYETKLDDLERQRLILEEKRDKKLFQRGASTKCSNSPVYFSQSLMIYGVLGL